MSHEERMKVIDKESCGGFALENGTLDSAAVSEMLDKVDVVEFVA